MSSSRLPLHPGDLVGTTYRIEQTLGTGAMGAVFAATDVRTGAEVAIKCLLPKHARCGALVQRFQREAYVGARLRSRHAVRIHGFGTLEGRGGDAGASGLPYIVMERLEGTDLGALLRERGRLDPRAAADYVAQACCAVAEAHALGVVHRDIKPGNLFLTRSGALETIKVTDFGIASFASPNAAGDPHKLTLGDMMLGTPAYMSPEQIGNSAEVDSRADIWSLGVTLYRLATGIAPFSGDTLVDLALSIVHERPPTMAALGCLVPPGLDDVVQRCLEKRPERRYRNAMALGMALTMFVYRSSWTAESRVPPTERLGRGAQVALG